MSNTKCENSVLSPCKDNKENENLVVNINGNNENENLVVNINGNNENENKENGCV